MELLKHVQGTKSKEETREQKENKTLGHGKGTFHSK
jgi:hypothetical protein